MTGMQPVPLPKQPETAEQPTASICALLASLGMMLDPSLPARQMVEKLVASIAELDTQFLELKQRIRNLEGLALNDELTGALNRHGFFQELRREIARTRRNPDRGLCIVMIDLDDFKAINDTMGHPAGDACLKLAVNALRCAVRDCDLVARLGGDEFVVALGDLTNMDISRRTDEIRERLNGSFLPWGDATIHVHGSVGFSIYQDGDDEKSLIQRADRMLYRQKALKKSRSS